MCGAYASGISESEKIDIQTGKERKQKQGKKENKGKQMRTKLEKTA